MCCSEVEVEAVWGLGLSVMSVDPHYAMWWLAQSVMWGGVGRT